MTRFLPMALGAIVCGLLLIYALWPTPLEVEVVAVSRGALLVTVDEDGKTRVKERYIVSAPLSGLLGRMELHPGDVVQENQSVIATIEPTNPALLDARSLAEAESRLQAAEAAKEQAEARKEAAREAHGLAEHELVRAKGLLRTAAVSQAEFDTAEHQERITAATFLQAQFGDRVATFELELAKAAFVRTRPVAKGDAPLERLAIRSPVTGQVFRVLQENATVVTPGQALVEIGNTRELEIVIDVLSSDAPRILPGARVFIEHAGAAASLMARVRLVEPSGFTKISALGVEEQRVNVIADFDDTTDGSLGLGDEYRVDARIVAWQSDNAIKVPSGALFRQDEAWAVFIVKNGIAQLRRVEIGHMNGQEAEVKSGLEPAELVINYPSDKVRPGVSVSSLVTQHGNK